MCRERRGSGKEENAPAEVVSNIVSECGQMAGLVFLTKATDRTRFERKPLNRCTAELRKQDRRRVLEIPGSFIIHCLPVPRLTALRCPAAGVSVAALR
jgi:hypothetical protein